MKITKFTNSVICLIGLALAACVSMPAQTATRFNTATMTGDLKGSSASKICWNSDSGITRNAAAVFNMGACSPGDATGSLRLTQLLALGVVTTSGSTGLPTGGAAAPYLFSSNSTPHGGAMLVGDGSGWQFDFVKRSGSANTFLVTVKDNGCVGFYTTSGTLLNSVCNDTAGGFAFTSNGGHVLQWSNSGTLFLGNASDKGLGVGFFGATSGTANLLPPAVAGSTNLTLPAAGTDTLVARADTASLSGKSLTGASSGNNVTLQAACTILASGAITGNGADQNIFSCTVPANTIEANKCIRLRATWTHSTGTAAVTYKVKWGGTTLATHVEATNPNGILWDVEICNGATNAQQITLWYNDASAAQFIDPASGTADTTAGVAFAVTFSVAGTDAITPKLQTAIQEK